MWEQTQIADNQQGKQTPKIRAELQFIPFIWMQLSSGEILSGAWKGRQSSKDTGNKNEQGFGFLPDACLPPMLKSKLLLQPGYRFSEYTG